MHHVGIYGADRGLGSTLLAAHLYYFLSAFLGVQRQQAKPWEPKN